MDKKHGARSRENGERRTEKRKTKNEGTRGRGDEDSGQCILDASCSSTAN
jgi:hypothetical protein